MLELDYHCSSLNLSITSLCFIAPISIAILMLSFKAHLEIFTSVLKWAYFREIYRYPHLPNKKLGKYKKHYDSLNVSELRILINLSNQIWYLETWPVWCIVVQNCNVLLVNFSFDGYVVSFPICSDEFWLGLVCHILKWVQKIASWVHLLDTTFFFLPWDTVSHQCWCMFFF